MCRDTTFGPKSIYEITLTFLCASKAGNLLAASDLQDSETNTCMEKLATMEAQPVSPRR